LFTDENVHGAVQEHIHHVSLLAFTKDELAE